MTHAYLLVCAGVMSMLIGAGCRGEFKPIRLRTGQSLEIAEHQPGWKGVRVDPQDKPKLRPMLIPAERARQAPALKLSTFAGEERNVTPGRAGRVTLVVVWSMDFHFTKAAARHVQDLSDKYVAHGVRAFGILEKTASARFAPGFIRKQKIDYPVYHDDFSALRSLARAARVSVDKDTPCFFIIDRKQRVRFFKRGFRCTTASLAGDSAKEEHIIENAAPGEHIEDYLKEILRER